MAHLGRHGDTSSCKQLEPMIQDPKIWPLVPVCTCHQHQAEDLITGTRSARPLKGLAWLMVKMDLTLGMLMIERCYNLSMYMIERERDDRSFVCICCHKLLRTAPERCGESVTKSAPARCGESATKPAPARCGESVTKSNSS